MRKIAILIFIVLLSSCNMLKYSFVENITGRQKDNFFSQIKDQAIDKRGELRGVFVEKNTSYKFIATYDLYTKYIRLRFYSLIDAGDLIFDVYMKDGDKEYDFFIDSFFSVKIGNLLDQFYYIFDIYNKKDAKLKITNEDYFVTIDNKGNYRKYENNIIIKKENYKYMVKYFYENDALVKIKLQHNFNIFYLILKK